MREAKVNMKREKQTLICIKLAPASFATALAINVLPQPGGPKSKNPTSKFTPSSWRTQIYQDKRGYTNHQYAFQYLTLLITRMLVTDY